MKAIIYEDNSVDKKTPFPKLMCNRYNGLIVLFYKQNWGTVLVQGKTKISIGFHECNWNMSDFFNCTFPVILQND